MRRKEAREKAMNLLFQMDVHNEFTPEFIEENLDDELEDDLKQAEYVRDIAKIYVDHKGKVDAMIEENAKEWKLNRIAKVDLAILRVAITEMNYVEDIPPSVSINEAVEMAKTFSTEESGSFVNGVLGNIAKGLE